MFSVVAGFFSRVGSQCRERASTNVHEINGGKKKEFGKEEKRYVFKILFLLCFLSVIFGGGEKTLKRAMARGSRRRR